MLQEEEVPVNREIVLFNTHEQALTYRKSLAAKGPAACFGITATTFSAWLADAWELYGDGRAIISSIDRSFAVRQVLADSAQEGPLELTDGGIALVCRFFSEAIGLDALDAALAKAPCSLSVQEQALLGLVVPYRILIAEQGFIEIGDALACLAESQQGTSFAFGDGFESSPLIDEFMGKIGVDCSASDAVPCRITGLKPAVFPQFLFASGPSAENALIARYVQHVLSVLRGKASSGSVLVVTARPFSVFKTLSEALAENEVECILQANRPFYETEFGRAYQGIREFLLDPHHDSRALMDFISSPFSGAVPSAAAKIDSAVRGDRLLDFDELRAMTHLVTETYDLFEELVSDSDASLLLDRFIDVAEDLKGFDAAAVFEQQIAISALRSVYEAARCWGVSPEGFDFALSSLSVDASRSCGAGPFKVVVVDATRAGRIDPSARYNVVVRCDLDARYVSASESHNALITLEEKLGIPVQAHALQDARRSFELVKASAMDVFVCERVLNAGGDEDVYPSFVLDEYCECLREGDEGMDAFGVPEHLAPLVATRDEGGSRDGYAANYDAQGIEPDSFALPAFKPGVLSSSMVPLLTLFRAPDNADVAVLSPSALEEYVNCPYRWYAGRRLRPEAPDEELGPLEQGVFVHGVWEAFYSHIDELMGSSRVDLSNVAQAKEVLCSVFDEQLALQPSGEGARYLPLTPTELAQAERLKQTLVGNLDVQARMLPGFAPAFNEFSIEPDQGIDYAGIRLFGRVDRIDVAQDRAHYVVVDYKGGISGHEAGFDPDECDELALPSKVQALIYAQVLRKAQVPGRPVGALYLSYRASEPAGSIAGSFDAALLDTTGFARNASAVNMNFESYLDMVEAEIAKRVGRLLEGDIAPNPLCAASCSYCPVRYCEKRLS